MSVGNNKIIVLLEQSKKRMTASLLNNNLEKSSGWSLYKNNGTLVNGSSNNLGADISGILSDSDDEDPIIATGDYFEHEDKGERYNIIVNGDINPDGTVDIKDLYQSFLLYKGKQGDISDEQYYAGDYDNSGKIDIIDLYKIYKKMKE